MPPSKSEDRLADLEAPPQDFDKALQGRRVGPVAAQDGEVQRDAAGVGGHGEDDLRPVAAVIAAMAIAAEVRRAFPLKVNAGQVVENEAERFLEGLRGQPFFQGAPVASQRVHRLVQLVLVKALIGGEPAGRGEQRAGGALGQGELGTGKKQAREDQRLEQGTLTRRADPGEEVREPELLPDFDEDGEAAIVERLLKLDLLRPDEALAGERVGDELADRRRQPGEVANGAGARPLGGAEGLAHEIGLVNLGAAAGSGDLNEHWLRG